MAKINWSKALQDYISDETISYEKIAEKYGVNINAVKQKGAEEGWLQIRAETKQKLIQHTIEKTASQIAEVNARHINIGRLLQTQGIVAIEKDGIKIKFFKDAKEAIETGVSIERKGLGMDQKDSVTINVGYQSPTWYKQVEEK